MLRRIEEEKIKIDFWFDVNSVSMKSHHVSLSVCQFVGKIKILRGDRDIEYCEHGIRD